MRPQPHTAIPASITAIIAELEAAPEPLASIGEAASITGICRTAINRGIAERRIASVILGGRRLVPKTELARLIREGAELAASGASVRENSTTRKRRSPKSRAPAAA